MAATLVITAAGPGGAVPERENRRSQRSSEIWRVVGNASSAGDTGTFTPNYIKKIQDVVGPYSWSQSGGVITLVALVAQTSTQIAAVEVLGFE